MEFEANIMSFPTCGLKITVPTILYTRGGGGGKTETPSYANFDSTTQKHLVASIILLIILSNMSFMRFYFISETIKGIRTLIFGRKVEYIPKKCS